MTAITLNPASLWSGGIINLRSLVDRRESDVLQCLSVSQLVVL